MFDRYEVLSFDCYGTLIDWETGIATTLRPWAARHGLPTDTEWLIAAHGSHETHVQQDRPASPYPDVLAETLRRIGAEHGAEVTDEEAVAYGASVGEWPAFADSAKALSRLSEQYRLVIVSNVDRASFARSNERLGVAFDAIISAEDVGSYKPGLGHFAALLALLEDWNVPQAALLHVAESRYHDIEPATALGLATAWIHRRHGKAGTGATAAPGGSADPTYRFTSMAELADAATA